MKDLFRITRKIAITGFIVMGFFMMALFIKNFDEIFSNDSYDLNEFAIDTISDDDIAKVKAARIYLSHNNYTSGTSTGAPQATKYEDSDRVFFTCENMFGISSISSTKASDCTLVFRINSVLHSGRAEIVITRDDQEVLDRFEFGGDFTQTFKVEGEHFYRIRILAEDAKLEIEVIREIEK